MARGDLIKKLFASYGRDGDFRAVAELIIAEEEKKGNNALARALHKQLEIIVAGQTKPATRAASAAPSAAAPKGLAPLIPFPDAAAEFVERIEPRYKPQDIFLSGRNFGMLAGLVLEHRRREEILRRGLPVRSRLLLCGGPGTGKTMCAEVFAGELGLPLFVVKLDRLISSYLGETASNIRKIFEFARTHPSVVFLDEFDALARARDNDAEHGELRRVVNSLLVFIDRIQPSGFLIAATNLEGSLDPAIWRRFDEVIWFDLPTKLQVRRFVERKFRNVAVDFDVREEADALVGFSYADIERACLHAIKAPILKRRKTVTRHNLKTAIRDLVERRDRLAGK